jgi:predicted nuclease of predicted toxin-antitoxin system
LLQFALNDDRVFITEDKDFGELVFVQNRSHGPIVRLVQLTVAEQVQAVSELLDQRSQELSGPIIVTISRARVRVRRRESK